MLHLCISHLDALTQCGHWCYMTLLNMAVTSSGNTLLHFEHQALRCINCYLMSIRPLETNRIENVKQNKNIIIEEISFENVISEMVPILFKLQHNMVKRTAEVSIHAQLGPTQWVDRYNMILATATVALMVGFCTTYHRVMCEVWCDIC